MMFTSTCGGSCKFALEPIPGNGTCLCTRSRVRQTRNNLAQHIQGGKWVRTFITQWWNIPRAMAYEPPALWYTVYRLLSHPKGINQHPTNILLISPYIPLSPSIEEKRHCIPVIQLVIPVCYITMCVYIYMCMHVYMYYCAIFYACL